jgi:hypothetical protein
MTIELAKDVEEFLREQLHAGAANDVSKLANDLLRSMREMGKFEVTPELEAWLLETVESPATPLTGRDFEGIRARVRGRTHQTP